MNSDEYTCAHCGWTFKKGRTDEEAKQEADDLFPGLAPENGATVCDDCWRAMPIAAWSAGWNARP